MWGSPNQQREASFERQSWSFLLKDFQEINGATGPKKVKLQKEKKGGGIVDAVVQFCFWFKQ